MPRLLLFLQSPLNSASLCNVMKLQTLFQETLLLPYNPTCPGIMKEGVDRKWIPPFTSQSKFPHVP